MAAVQRNLGSLVRRLACSRWILGRNCAEMVPSWLYCSRARRSEHSGCTSGCSAPMHCSAMSCSSTSADWPRVLTGRALACSRGSLSSWGWTVWALPDGWSLFRPPGGWEVGGGTRGSTTSRIVRGCCILAVHLVLEAVAVSPERGSIGTSLAEAVGVARCRILLPR